MKQKIINNLSSQINSDFAENRERGFSLIEATIAMFILLIVLLGVFVTFAYAVNYNAGNSARSQALAVLQQKVEQLRSDKFTPQVISDSLKGGKKSAENVTLLNGNKFVINVTVDDDPSTPDVVDVDTTGTKTVKQITISVSVANPTLGWQTAVPTKVVFRRARAN